MVMKTFLLIERVDKRVVLEPTRDLKDNESILQTLTHKTWLEARIKVNEENLYQDYGKGWYKR